MITNVTRHTGIVVRKIFEMLLDEPEGMSIREICERLQDSRSQSQNGSDRPGEWDLGSFQKLTFGCVAPIRAGWLHIDRHQWSVSDEGRRAYDHYPDPEQFMLEAGKRSTRGWLSVHFP